MYSQSSAALGSMSQGPVLLNHGGSARPMTLVIVDPHKALSLKIQGALQTTESGFESVRSEEERMLSVKSSTCFRPKLQSYNKASASNTPVSTIQDVCLTDTDR